jgi:hypothetical protein
VDLGGMLFALVRAFQYASFLQHNWRNSVCFVNSVPVSGCRFWVGLALRQARRSMQPWMDCWSNQSMVFRAKTAVTSHNNLLSRWPSSGSTVYLRIS